MKKYFLIIIIFTIMTSCNNEKPIDQLRLVKYEIDKNDIYLDLQMLVLEDDIFNVFYTEDNSFNYSGDKMLVTEVKGSVKYQNIIFNFPNNAKPTAIRIDIGENPNQKKIYFKKFLFKYFDKKLVIEDSLNFYYGTNSYFSFNTKENIFIPNNNKFKYDPILFCRHPLVEKLNQLIKE